MEGVGPESARSSVEEVHEIKGMPLGTRSAIVQDLYHRVVLRECSVADGSQEGVSTTVPEEGRATGWKTSHRLAVQP